jgi:hypothetical protein
VRARVEHGRVDGLVITRQHGRISDLERDDVQRPERRLRRNGRSRGDAGEQAGKHERGRTKHAALLPGGYRRVMATQRKWSGRVTETSNALDIPSGTFALDDPTAIARELLRDAQRSRRRKATSPYRSAMSMLTFYINRAGANLPAKRKAILERAKDELRAIAGRTRA